MRVRKTNFLKLIFLVFGMIALGGCTLEEKETIQTSVVIVTVSTNSPVPPTLQILPSTTSEPPATPTVENTIAQPVFEVCSPLLAYEIKDLPAMVVNPYSPPTPGRDEPHQGVDIAVRISDDGVAQEGNEVQAILPGRVAGVINDRFPYGNAIIVETPFREIPSNVTGNMPERTSAPWAVPPLSCPDATTLDPVTSEQTSIYVMYAHLRERVGLRVGTMVPCGQKLGRIGSSGNALNPHLHLEARMGPSEVDIPVMAHYDTSATAEEMASYCLWRVSGTFQVLNPLILLGFKP